MEQNKTIFNYIGQVFAAYGIVVAVFIGYQAIVLLK